jgi:hypothetical protein
MYDELFKAGPESILEKRLKEAPGEEDMSLKEAGFNDVWSSFLGEFFENGWNHAVRSAATLEKVASTEDPYLQGQNEAVDFILKNEQSESVIGWYQFIKKAYDSKDPIALAEKFVAEPPPGGPEAVQGFLSACETVISSDHDLAKIAWHGPFAKESGETEMLDAFALGKRAALKDLLEQADELGGISPLNELVHATLELPLEKEASAEDSQYRLGIDSICYSFLKEAAAYYGEWEVEDHDLALSDILEKVAADYAKTPDYASAMHDPAKYEAQQHGGSLTGRGPELYVEKHKARAKRLARNLQIAGRGAAVAGRAGARALGKGVHYLDRESANLAAGRKTEAGSKAQKYLENKQRSLTRG